MYILLRGLSTGFSSIVHCICDILQDPKTQVPNGDRSPPTPLVSTFWKAQGGTGLVTTMQAGAISEAKAQFKDTSGTTDLPSSTKSAG
jgi:hypothetical protein